MKLKTLAISAVVAGMLIGCGSTDSDTNTTSSSSSGSTTSNSSTKSTSGVAADGYLAGATVFLDKNYNTILDEGEPSTKTDKDGKFNLEYPKEASGQLVVKGGNDVEKGSQFRYVLKVPLKENINITPLTMSAYLYKRQKVVSYEEAINKLADSLGVSPNDFIADPEKTSSIKNITTQMFSAIEAMSKYVGSTYENRRYKQIFENFVIKLANSTGSTPEEKITNAFKNIDLDFVKKPAKTVALSIFKQVGEMAKNGDFSNYNDVFSNTIKIVKTNPTLDVETITQYVKTNVESLQNDNIKNSRDKINNLQTSLSDLNNTTYSKEANVGDAKTTMSQIRDIIYEVIDPNIDDQEQNSTTLVGNIADNYEKYLKPATEQISDDIDALNENIDTSLKNFDEQLDKDFNDSISALDNRLDALGEILDKYDDNQTFDEEETAFGDKISHPTYKVEDGIVTTTYSLNGETLTTTYPQKTNVNETEVKVSGEVSLQEDDKYNLKVKSLSLKDNKLVLNTTGEIYGKDDAKIDAKIKISVNVDNDNFSKGNIVQSLNNIDLEIDGNIKTSNNQTFNGLITLNDKKLFLDGKFEDSNIELDANVTVNATNTEWKRYEDEDYQAEAYDHWLPIIYVDDKLSTKIDYNHNTKDINLTSYDGKLYECNVIDGNLWNGNISCDKAEVKEYKSQDLYNKVITISVNNKPMVLNDVWYDWIWNGGGDIESVSLNLESGVYELDYENKETVLYIGDAKEDVTSVSDLTLSEPMKADDLVGGIKVNGYVKDNNKNIEAKLNVGIVSNGASKEIIIDNLALTTNNLDVTIHSIKTIDNKDTNITTTLLNGIDGTLTDKNNNDVKLTDVYILNSENVIPDTKEAEFYGKVSYLDTTFSGYIKASKDEEAHTRTKSIYTILERKGYEPITIIGSYNKLEEHNDYDMEYTNILFEKGNYKLGAYITKKDFYDYEKNDSEMTTLWDNNGVIGEIKSEDSRLKSVILKNSKNEKLADLNKTDNNWEIKYSDDSTETLY